MNATDPQSLSIDQGEDACALMLAHGIAQFGPPSALVPLRIRRPSAGRGQVLVRVAAAGVGPWDAWIRAGQSTRILAKDLPVTLGSDISGTVEEVGADVAHLDVGDIVYGVSNAHFTGGYAEFAAAEGAMLARMPEMLSFEEAASVPVIGCTAWQMLFEHGKLEKGQRVLVLGGAGNVGAFAVQIANLFGAHVVATGSPTERGRLRRLGAAEVIDPRLSGPLRCSPVDLVIDTVGGDLQTRAMAAMRHKGVLVSSVSAPDPAVADSIGVKGVFFIVDVNTKVLTLLAAMLDAGDIETHVGVVLPLKNARTAHEMLEGNVPRPSGKIVLNVDSPTYNSAS